MCPTSPPAWDWAPVAERLSDTTVPVLKLAATVPPVSWYPTSPPAWASRLAVADSCSAVTAARGVAAGYGSRILAYQTAGVGVLLGYGGAGVGVVALRRLDGSDGVASRNRARVLSRDCAGVDVVGAGGGCVGGGCCGYAFELEVAYLPAGSYLGEQARVGDCG